MVRSSLFFFTIILSLSCSNKRPDAREEAKEFILSLRKNNGEHLKDTIASRFYWQHNKIVKKDSIIAEYYLFDDKYAYPIDFSNIDRIKKHLRLVDTITAKQINFAFYKAEYCTHSELANSVRVASSIKLPFNINQDSTKLEFNPSSSVNFYLAVVDKSTKKKNVLLEKILNKNEKISLEGDFRNKIFIFSTLSNEIYDISFINL